MGTFFIMELTQLQEAFDQMKADKATVEGKMRKYESQWIGNLPPRVSPTGQELPTINLNETQKTVLTCTRIAIADIWNREKILKSKFISLDDIDLADNIDFYITHKVKHIEGGFATFLNIFLRTYTYGIGIGKLHFEDNKIDFEPVDVFDIWCDDRFFRYDDMQYIMQKFQLTDRQLEERTQYNNLGEYFDKVKEREAIRNKDKEDELISPKRDIYEIWYKEGKDWYVTTSGADEEGLVTKFRDEKGELYGHPFVFFPDLPTLGSLYNLGEAEIIREYQKGMTEILNLNIDYLNATIRPPTVYEPDLLVDGHEAEGLIDPYGGLTPVSDVNKIKTLFLGSLNPESFGMLGFLKDSIEERTVHARTLSGVQAEKREPYRATALRTSLAQSMMGFRILISNQIGLRPLGQKILINFLKNPPEKDLIRLVGEEGYLSIEKSSKRSLEEKPYKAKSGKLIHNLILKIGGMSDEDILSFADIEIDPAAMEDTKEFEKNEFREFMLSFAQLISVYPELRDEIEASDLLKQLFKKQGFNMMRILKDKRKLTPEQIGKFSGLTPEQMTKIKTKQGGGGVPAPGMV